MPTHADNAWSDLTTQAETAAANGSGWGRYGLPFDAIEFRSEAEASQPAPELPADAMPADVCETITALDEAIRIAGSLPEPCPAWIGLELSPEAGGFPFPFKVGRHICLTGFVSGSLLMGPAVYAAGPDGLLLHVRIAAAMPMNGELGRPGEMELVPPRNTCYRVDAVHESVVVTDEHGRVWTRAVIEATQVPMEAQRPPVARVVEGG